MLCSDHEHRSSTARRRPTHLQFKDCANAIILLASLFPLRAVCQMPGLFVICIDYSYIKYILVILKLFLRNTCVY